MQLYNVMERVVKEALDDVMKINDSFCKCQECQVDIMAIALNQLPPKYVGTRKGEVYSKLNTLSNQFNSDAYREITKAIEVVKNKPHHETTPS
ncbi:hypothetical protein BHF68_08440 [Desulfuribacillus alkaliarsenatis]|uniref:Competence protein ComFB n=1 Tax=Desulfuribacillus alkaliarsenatis TaxID=766136 RepID=A0A1E5G0M3_9FIRM|nr:hypothetical protein BHF68_08440 [Desulfuribacillus alkaliarsenatis]